ncbi:MAG TPA: hypothetical protein VFP84_07060, partial [Kofleriaceae bacterium]|nr:hypothetical protein [Kofleriaceae bacterium]
VALKKDAAANDGIVAPSSSKAAAPGKRKAIGIAVEGRELQPKDLDEQKLARADRDGAARPSAPSGAASGGGAPPAKPVPATVARAGAFATPPPAAELAGDVATDKADAKADAKPADGNVLGWAQRQHAQVVALVRANNCRAAASAAAEIYNRAPDFYASTVESDREIRPCLSYVTSERERVDRARAAKRGNAAADQGAAPAQAVPSATPAQVPRP